ncbi:glycosyltransferase [Microbacterium sp. NPDC058345]|uniref:glycosyltransferase n=1 Tax=Microbacterium sp. NPDC058345 TaxID=3346455 RepID=UPI0036691353
MTGSVGFVASPGGHVDEAFEIAERFAPRADRFWVTARTPQTESLLAAETVVWVPEVKSRQGLKAARSLAGAVRIMRQTRPRSVVSTGAALTVPYMLAARALRIPLTYVESATRLTSPSQTGRIIERVPGTRLFHQGSDWGRGAWQQFGSVFDNFEAHPAEPRTVRRALVTLGSEKFPFPRALRESRDALSAAEVAWQVGNTPAEDATLTGDVRQWWPGDELAAAARSADVIITHAGVGSILMALRAGVCPVVLARTARLGEHVDDHQVELAARLDERGLVTFARPGDALADHVQAAQARRIVRRPQ